MIPALIIGREGSTGFPNKNITPFLGRPLMEYPILAAQNSKYVDDIFISTDSDQIRKLGESHGLKNIDRPEYLATNDALAEDAFAHGYREIKSRSDKPIEFIILLFCNGACITPGIIDQGIEFLRQDTKEKYDSAVTTSLYNMWSPLRAKQIVNDTLEPFFPIEMFKNASCDRGSQGDCWFADCSAFVVRPKCLENLEYGENPFRWMGRKVYPLKQWGGLDLDFEWQKGQVEFWLEQHGFTGTKTPYDK
jgi:CMP-N-acetylneuraminic acid synthetase